MVGLLKDNTGYGVYGDHGGAQKDVQRIPMVMYAKGMKHIESDGGVPPRRRHADRAPHDGHQADARRWTAGRTDLPLAEART